MICPRNRTFRGAYPSRVYRPASRGHTAHIGLTKVTIFITKLCRNIVDLILQALSGGDAGQ